MAELDSAEFTFNWRALKLLGKGLYSNPWSALSELVANGLDAGARTVKVYVDATDNSNAMIEIIDDGSGMSREDIDTYVKVGHNKRYASGLEPGSDASRHMGRKGIGKLAALFLSPRYYLQTRSNDGSSSWLLDAREGQVDDDEHPTLIAMLDAPSTPNDSFWDQISTGTRLTLLDVDLSGYGKKSIEALSSRLANQFLVPELSGSKIEMCVRFRETSGNPQYAEVRKQVAFNNFAALARHPSASEMLLDDWERLQSDPTVQIPSRLLADDSYQHVRTYPHFRRRVEFEDGWDELAALVDLEEHTYAGIPYSLKGWIGVHSTIENEPARLNDERFTKNKFYNPAQIRVYVRGKLASDRLLSQLGITGTYANYIEGEVTFDILDDDRLPDIATSNRQDFDETDGRLLLLRALLRPIVRSLIQERTRIAEAMRELAAKKNEDRKSAGKKMFAVQLEHDLASYAEIPEEVRADLQNVVVNKIEGDVQAKTENRIFISHARADAKLADFIYESLIYQGVDPDEVFYTSKSGDIEKYRDARSLGLVIKEAITSANTLIFYLTSKNFLRSQYCLFEGGAGWATRGVSDYLKLNVDFDSIPQFLTNGRSEISLIDGGVIELRQEVHNYIIDCVLNPMIDHINLGRDAVGREAVPRFEIPAVPTLLEVKRSGADFRDYLNPDLRENWDILVSDALEEYLAEYAKLSAEDSGASERGAGTSEAGRSHEI